MSCLAGILIVISYNMSEWRSFRSIMRSSFFDIIILLSTFFLTILVDLTVAIQVGVVLSALLFMKRMSDIGVRGTNEIDSDLIEDYTKLPEVVSVYEISGPLFFASAKQYLTTIKSLGFNSKILIIRMRHVPFVDYTGINNLKEVVKSLKKSGVTVILSGVSDTVMKELEKNNILSIIGRWRVFDSFASAVEDAKNLALSYSKNSL